MASNALIRLTNNTAASFAFDVSMSKPVKFVSRLVLPASGSAEVEVEVVVPMVLFSASFQNAIVEGDVTIEFAFTTAAGPASTATAYLANILRFLASTPTGWEAV